MFGSVPCACVLVSPLYYKPSVNRCCVWLLYICVYIFVVYVFVRFATKRRRRTGCESMLFVVRIYMCVYIYVYIYTCVCVRSVTKRRHRTGCESMLFVVRIYMCVCVCIYIYMCVCVCVCAFRDETAPPDGM